MWQQWTCWLIRAISIDAHRFIDYPQHHPRHPQAASRRFQLEYILLLAHAWELFCYGPEYPTSRFQDYPSLKALVWIPSEPHAQKMPWGCDNYCGKAFLLSKIPFCMYFALTCQIHQVDWWWERIARHRGGNTLWYSCCPVIFIALAAWVCGLIVSDLGKPGTIRMTLNPWNILQQVMTQCPGCSLKFPTLDLSQCRKCSKKDNVGSQIECDAIDVLFFFFVSCLWLIVSRFWC